MKFKQTLIAAALAAGFAATAQAQVSDGVIKIGVLSDMSSLYADIAGKGLLPVEAENQGKVVITTEMGGSENVTAQVHALTQRGLRNVLAHLGHLAGPPAAASR